MSDQHIRSSRYEVISHVGLTCNLFQEHVRRFSNEQARSYSTSEGSAHATPLGVVDSKSRRHPTASHPLQRTGSAPHDSVYQAQLLSRSNSAGDKALQKAGSIGLQGLISLASGLRASSDQLDWPSPKVTPLLVSNPSQPNTPLLF